ncbi:MAG: TolC family protein [Spirochaetia bacterium]|nr:TolC family protein [Spirochaetia bacterium]
MISVLHKEARAPSANVPAAKTGILLMLLISLASIVAAPLWAESDTDSTQLTLSKAEEIGLKTNADIILSKNRVSIAENDRGIAGSRLYPDLSVSAGYNYMDPPAGGKIEIIPPFTKTVGFYRNDNFSLGTELRYILYAGGRHTTGIELARLSEEASKWLLKDTVRSTRFEIRRAFVYCLLSKELGLVAKESRDRAKDRLRDAENNFKSGAISKIDLLRARADAADADLVLSESQDHQKAALDRLKIVLNMPLDQEIDPVGDLKSVAVTIDALDRSTLRSAEPEFARLYAARVRAEQARQNVKLQEGESMPTIVTGLKYDYTNPYQAQKRWGDTVNMFFGVSLPLFDGGRLASSKKKAELEAENASIQADDLSKQLTSYYRMLLDRIDSLSRGLSARRATLQTVTASRDAAAVGWKNGAITMQQMLDSELVVSRIQVQYLKNIADILEASADWERLTGKESGIFKSSL